MSFEQLKREAANLERQLEDKLSRYQQLVQKINNPAKPGVGGGGDSLSRAEEGSTTSSINDDENALQNDLDRLFQRLQDLISGRLTTAAHTASHQAAVRRFREILLDLRSDYDKSKTSVKRAKERNELLFGTNRSNSGNESDSAMDHLLRERNHIQNSLNVASDVIDQAGNIRQDLYGQGRSLRNTGTLMAQLTSNIPGLNHLVDAIRRKRSRDDKIVASVIAVCIVFTLWYVLG